MHRDISIPNPRFRLRAVELFAGFIVSCTPQGGPADNPAARGSLSSEHQLVGSSAPDFELEVVSGDPKLSRLSATSGIRLLDFWATWCEPCRRSFPEYQALSQRHSGKLVVIAVSEDDEPDGIAAFVEHAGATFPVAWDRDKSIAARYRIESMPTLFIIDRNGLVRHVLAGFRGGDEAQVAAAVDSLLAE